MSPIEKKNGNLSKFLIVACTCFIVYLANSIVRNLLSVNSTLMIHEGYSSVAIGVMSSVYLAVHGATQLLVCFIGDRAKLKYMVLFGAGSAGVCCYLFAAVDSIVVKTIVWGVCGFGLSFLYAPLVKSIADRLEGRQAEISMVLLDISSTLGGTLAGLFGVLGDWRMSMIIMASVMVFVAVTAFAVHFFFDRKYPLLKPRRADGKEEVMPLKPFLGYWMKHGAVAFLLICCLQGIAANTIVFWIPTYLSEYLKFSPQTASILFSVITLVAASNEIISIALYHLMKDRMMWVIRLSFLLSAVGFALLIFIPNPYANVAVLLLAKSAYGWVGPVIWTYYCRSFKDVNRVAFVISILNCMGYLASSVTSYLFSETIVRIGWVPLIIIWAALMLTGSLVSLLYRDKRPSPAAPTDALASLDNASADTPADAPASPEDSSSNLCDVASTDTCDEASTDTCDETSTDTFDEASPASDASSDDQSESKE